MKRILAISATALLLAVGLAPASAAGVGTVTFRVTNQDGSPSEFQQIHSTLFDKSYLTNADGEVSISILTGVQAFVGSFYPKSEALNTHFAKLNFEVNVIGDMTINIPLPRVLESSATLTDSAGKHLNQAPIRLDIWGCSTSAVSIPLAEVANSAFNLGMGPQFIHRTSQGVRNLPGIFNRYSRGIRALEGVATFAVFEDTCSLPRTFRHLDVFAPNKFAISTNVITEQKFLSGGLKFEIDGAPTFQVSNVARTISNQMFVITGKLTSPSEVYEELNGELSAGQAGYDFVTSSINLSRHTIDSDGNFRAVLLLDKNKATAESMMFFSTASGFKSELFRIPSFLAVSQKTLATYSGNRTSLTELQKSQVMAAVEANPDADKFICTGIRYYSQSMSVNIMVRKRAKAACEYAKDLNPSLSTWYQNKPTQARSYAGKVLLTIKSPY
jgi:hypothetical protein